MLASVEKTSKALVLHEDTHTGGFGAEIVATIAEEAFEHLDAPVKRVTAPDTPVPFSPPLEKAFIPQVEDVVAGSRSSTVPLPAIHACFWPAITRRQSTPSPLTRLPALPAASAHCLVLATQARQHHWKGH